MGCMPEEKADIVDRVKQLTFDMDGLFMAGVREMLPRDRARLALALRDEADELLAIPARKLTDESRAALKELAAVREKFERRMDGFFEAHGFNPEDFG